MNKQKQFQELNLQKTYVFDYLGTSDGYEVGWLHEESQREIEDPDSELFYDKYGMMSVAEEIVKEGYHNYINYWLDDEDIEAWEEERDSRNPEE
ncbi:MAG: hypothetical protein GOVbin2056_23 [Prokaryotic dsDNA virus sp.]|nr:MAG: hypothetical protein GOVbin2056_23 [Prokaryotic dsDNA virus sp.]|tara:strand:- start:5368 stop:5649 length:282 start_codon:yes stop_codon:yes gene_type:complete